MHHHVCKAKDVRQTNAAKEFQTLALNIATTFTTQTCNTALRIYGTQHFCLELC